MLVDASEFTDENNSEGEEYLAKDRPRTDIQPPLWYTNLIARVLFIAKEIDLVGEPTIYSDVVFCDDC